MRARDTVLQILNEISSKVLEEGDFALAHGKPDEAWAEFENRLRICERLVEADPDNPILQESLAWTYERLGKIRREEGNLRRDHTSTTSPRGANNCSRDGRTTPDSR